MLRADFIVSQSAILDRYFALARGEEQARLRFERLALATYDCITGKSVEGCGDRKVSDVPFVPYRSAWRFADDARGAGSAVPPSLRQEWRDWKHEYDLLLERQPVLELRDALHTISESDRSSSWPQGWEAALRDWVDAGSADDPPFDDRRHVVTAEFYERLRQLRRRVGGWLYWDKRLERVIFATDDEWLQRQGPAVHVRTHAVSPEGADGDFYCEMQGGRTIRHVSVFGAVYYWATPDRRSNEQYSFTAQPQFDELDGVVEGVSEREFEEIWKSATRRK